MISAGVSAGSQALARTAKHSVQARNLDIGDLFRESEVVSAGFDEEQDFNHQCHERHAGQHGESVKITAAKDQPLRRFAMATKVRMGPMRANIKVPTKKPEPSALER